MKLYLLYLIRFTHKDVHQKAFVYAPNTERAERMMMRRYPYHFEIESTLLVQVEGIVNVQTDEA